MAQIKDNQLDLFKHQAPVCQEDRQKKILELFMQIEKKMDVMAYLVHAGKQRDLTKGKTSEGH